MNGHVSSWANIKAGVPQGSILGPLLFLIYINDLPKGLLSNTKLFADDTSLFSVIHDSSTMRNELNDELVKNNNWAYQWKTSFNTDPNRQARKIIFSRKTKKVNHSPLTFSESTVSQTTSQKHLGVILDSSLGFDEHLISAQSKTNKTIGLFGKFQNTLPRQALITIYKAFVRLYLDYGNILYDQAYKVDVIYMDLSKAFGSLNHELLIVRLKYYGLDQHAVESFRSYLSNHYQCCKINNTLRDWRKNIAGVPQGSILCPLLFNIFLNDIFFFLKDANLGNSGNDSTLYGYNKNLGNVICNLRQEFSILSN